MALTTHGHDFVKKETLMTNQTKPVHTRGFSSPLSRVDKDGSYVKSIGPQSRPLGAPLTMFFLGATRADARRSPR